MTALETPPSPTAERPTGSPQHDPRWTRPALVVLLLGTAVLYLWGLGSSGWANSFYSAAVQAGTESWKAFFFGSSDAANFITVDKTPAALWVMELSARLFGVNAWSILVPQALEGVASVGLLYAAVRRWYGPVAGLIAGAVLALTPVATLMFRFNNPDALLVLLLVGAVYATMRAIESAAVRAGTLWLALAGALIGFGFLTKMLQAFLIVPVLGLVFLVVAPASVRRRLAQLAIALVAMIVAGGWWVAIVELWPAGSRPYIGGSQNNSVLDLVLGYNGLGRLSGDETGSVTPGGGGAGSWGETGWNRLFNAEFGTQASWLIPAALVLLVAVLGFTGRAARTDRTRAGMLLWGGWLVVTGLVFSYMQGIIHPYYSVALAPAIGAVVGIGAVSVWRLRGEDAGRAVLAVAMAATAIWGFVLLGRSDWQPWLRWVVLVGGLAVAVGLAFTPRLARRVAIGLAAAAVVLGLAAPAAYAVQTASEPHSGAIPSAGPSSGFGSFGGRQGGGQFPGGGNRGGFQMPGGTGQLPGGTGNGGTQQFPGGTGQQPGGTQQMPGGTTGNGNGGFRMRGGGGLLNGSTPSAELTTLLKTNAGQFTWVAATIGSNSASGYQLATGDPVMAIGGFNGTDPTPTLAAFQAYVSAGRIHYFIGGGGGFGNSSSGTSSEITQWVEQNFTSSTVGGVTVYDLTS
ncbi:ArnT family glycosyltransferase [Cryptosporangium phraense]|uniref:Glycosyltransferase family 39 protein n=1 Tax=Cryptosporangium phraense TaxID=2593070 RepID=A0A545AEN4_9ACTN|nr:glycosyltransferase family 39 protein [Cryptosporangium phraense]TQS39773.1 glycosyltransferase family 39 protein [Cryptosporangium phraense]